MRVAKIAADRTIEEGGSAMSFESERAKFTAEHHALLFAWMVRELVNRVGEEKASPVIRKAVRAYGNQRGKRMALRAALNGHALSMLNYIVYGEWKAGKGEMITNIIEKKPHVRATVPRCPWYTAWERHNLTPYGRYYCLDVDRALVYGFNPELKLDIPNTKPEGAAECEFVFNGASLGAGGMLALLFRKLVRPGKSALMPWDYHTAHVYRALRDVFVEELGDVGRSAVEGALEVFARHYGGGAADAVRELATMDFGALPAKG